MATVLQVLLVSPVQLTTSDAAYYTTPVNTTARIGRAVFSNTSSSNVTITVNVANGASSAANEIINTLTIPAKGTYVSPELAGAVLPPGYALRALASAGTSITLMVSGVTVA